MVGRECLLVRVFKCGYVSSACGIRDGLCLSSTFEMTMIFQFKLVVFSFGVERFNQVQCLLLSLLISGETRLLSIDYLSTPYILPDGRKTPFDSDRASVQRITSIGTTIVRVHNQTIALIPTILRLQVTIPKTALRANP
jgi:hypothetical protein